MSVGLSCVKCPIDIQLSRFGGLVSCGCDNRSLACHSFYTTAVIQKCQGVGKTFFCDRLKSSPGRGFQCRRDRCSIVRPQGVIPISRIDATDGTPDVGANGVRPLHLEMGKRRLPLYDEIFTFLSECLAPRKLWGYSPDRISSHIRRNAIRASIEILPQGIVHQFL